MATNRKIRPSRVALTLAGLLALGGNAGCIESLLASHAAAFGAGWAVGAGATPTIEQQTCFVNGEPVDCATVNQ